MVKHEGGIVRRVVKIGHVAVAANNAMDDIVQTLQAVGVAGVVHPRFCAELREVFRVGEEVVQPVPERDAVVVEDGIESFVLAGSVLIPAGWEALRLVP